ncbi:MAG: tetratricopeptide repeat protein [Trichodesmium sp. MAG_R03]|nr:tetratricopeptide repeat protein [Trichodesmium sp. MAG_R03]
MTVTAFTTGNQLLREGQLEEAIASYEKAIELNPQFAWCYQNLGDALEKTGRIDEAITVFRRAVANCPESPWCFYKLGVILGQQGQFQEGVGYLRQAIELKKDVPKFYLGLGSWLVKLGQWSEAVDCINQAMGMWDGKVGRLHRMSLQAEADFYLAEAKSGLGQWSEAVEFYGRSLEINPVRVECYLGWAAALGKLGRWSEVVELYRQGMVLFEESGELWFCLGKALGQLERWEEAVVQYGRSVGLGFAGSEVRHHLGFALGKLGRWEEAVVQYRLVLEVNQKSAVVRHQLGYALMRLGRWGEAEIELRKAAELHPGSAAVWQHLGDVLGELGERDEAESAYKRALELKSGKSSYVSDLSSPLPKMKGVTSNSLTREKIRKIDQKFDANYQGKRDSILKSRPKGSTYLNVLFVLYGNIDSNGGYHAQLHGTRLLEEGVDCIFAVPDSSNNEDVWRRSLQNLSNPVRILPYSAFSIPGSRLPFANGGGPDVIHAWTPREVVRKCVERLLKQYSCPLVIHLEDNEEYLTAAKVGRPFDELVKLPEAELDRIIPGDRYHPIKGKAFLQQAQGLTMIIETLKGFNISNVPELVLGPPVDESLFYPRPINQELRRSLGISEGHVVLAYTGNVHSGNRDEVGELYQAVEVLNQQGCPTVLLRTGLKGEEMGVESRGRSYEKYLGWVERGEVPEILAAADVLVQPGVPGVFNDERVPSKLLEYFAMGRPVVLPKTNVGLRVKHGLEGYVLTRCDAEGIVAAVQEIKADGELARRLSDGAVDFYLSQVKQGFMGVKLNDFYGRLTGKVSSPGDEKEVGRMFFVVTPCLNAGETIDETIKSVISQSGDFWIRYHVQDGGSTDVTVERLRYWEGVLLQGSSDVQCRGVEFSWVSEPDQGMYDGVMRGFDGFDIRPEELMTWINADDVLMPGALSAICGIVGEHPEVEWMGGPQYVFEMDVRRQVLERSTPTPTAVIREGLCDGKHWEMLQQEGTFFSKALWFRAKHGLKGFELAGDWNFWRVIAHHGVYYQYESPLGAFRRRIGQLSVERIGDYRAEIDRVVPLEVRRGRFEELYREQEWDANVIRFDGGTGKMVVDIDSVSEVYEKIRGFEQSNLAPTNQAETNACFEQANSLSPCVFIVTPVYNGVQFIDETIDGILSQSGDFFIRYHLQDGCSTDGTVEKLCKWKERLKSNNFLTLCKGIKFTFDSSPDSGMYDAINKGVAAIGNLRDEDCMTWLNADDRLLPGTLATIVSIFQSLPEVQWVTGRTELIDRDGIVTNLFDLRLFSSRTLRAGLHEGRKLHFLTQEGTFWRSKLWHKVGGLDSSLRLAGDYDLWLRMADYSDLVTVNAVLATHRRHEGQLSNSHNRYHQEVDQILSRKHLEEKYQETWHLYNSLSDHELINEHFMGQTLHYSVESKTWEIKNYQPLHSSLLKPSKLLAFEQGVKKSIIAKYGSGFSEKIIPEPSTFMSSSLRWLHERGNLHIIDVEERGYYQITLVCQTFEEVIVAITKNNDLLFVSYFPISEHRKEFHAVFSSNLEQGQNTINVEVRDKNDGCVSARLLMISCDANLVPNAKFGGNTSLLDTPEKDGWPYKQSRSLPWPKTLPNGEPWPKISIVTPSYNQGRFVEETILSVINQGYPNLEYIFIDGGSNDETMTIVNRYREHLTHVVSERDRGQSHALNKGFSKASGEILGWVNSDDRLAPGALYAIATAFYTSGADVVSGVCQVFQDEVLAFEHIASCSNGKLKLDEFLDLDNCWLAGKFFYQPEVMFSRRIWEKAGGQVNEALYYSMDYELWVKFAANDATIQVIGHRIAQFRMHDSQKTSSLDKYKPELLQTRDNLRLRYGLKSEGKKPYTHKSSLNILAFNDVGFHGGAGIAHKRIVESLSLAGHQVTTIAARSEWFENPVDISVEETYDTIAKINPDLIVVGNVHNINQNIEILERFASEYPTIFVLHDQWLLTGRCPYTGDCDRYMSLCDVNCPTSDQYPKLPPSEITQSFKKKRFLLESSDNILVLGGSNWIINWARKALISSKSDKDRAELEKKILSNGYGIDLKIFRSKSKKLSRLNLGLPEDKFIIITGSFGASDGRKGIGNLIDALDVVPADNLLLLIFGTNSNQVVHQLSNKKYEARSLGFISNPLLLATYYSASNLFVGASLEEVFGQTFIESAACGTPAVCYSVGGVAEAICDKVTGRLVKEKTPEALGKMIRELYLESGQLEVMSSLAPIYIANEFSFFSNYHKFMVALDESNWLDKLGLSPCSNFLGKSKELIQPIYMAQESGS